MYFHEKLKKYIHTLQSNDRKPSYLTVYAKRRIPGYDGLRYPVEKSFGRMLAALLFGCMKTRTAAGLLVIGYKPNSMLPELPASMWLIYWVERIWPLGLDDISKYILSKYIFSASRMPK